MVCRDSINSFLSRDQTHVPIVKAWSLTHWITREVPQSLLKRKKTPTLGYLLRNYKKQIQ